MSLLSGIELLGVLVVIGILFLLSLRWRARTASMTFLLVVAILFVALLSVTRLALALFRVALVIGALLVVLVLFVVISFRR